MFALIKLLLGLILFIAAVVGCFLFPFLAVALIVIVPVLVVSSIIAVPLMFSVRGTVECFTKEGSGKFVNWVGFAMLIVLASEIVSWTIK